MQSTRSSTLRIYSRDDYHHFIPLCPKLEGALPGYIGKFQSHDQRYLLKVEKEGRAFLTSRSADERSALESLSSQLIRAIFGSSYAADIHLMELGGSKVKPVWIGNRDNIKIKVTSNYGVLSVWEENCKPLTSYTKKPDGMSKRIFSENITRIETIAKLINMNDYKTTNIVMRRDDYSFFLVDCAANFAGFGEVDQLLTPECHFKLHHHFIPSVALQVIKQFASFDEDHLKRIVSEYTTILNPASMKLLLENIEKTRSNCKALLNQFANIPVGEFKLFKCAKKKKAPLGCLLIDKKEINFDC